MAGRQRQIRHVHRFPLPGIRRVLADATQAARRGFAADRGQPPPVLRRPRRALRLRRRAAGLRHGDLRRGAPARRDRHALLRRASQLGPARGHRQGGRETRRAQRWPGEGRRRRRGPARRIRRFLRAATRAFAFEHGAVDVRRGRTRRRRSGGRVGRAVRDPRRRDPAGRTDTEAQRGRRCRSAPCRAGA